MAPAQQAGADDSSIEVYGNTAAIMVAQGTNSITAGPPSTSSGPVYECGYYPDGHGFWHTGVLWFDLVAGEAYYMHCILRRGDGAITYSRWITYDPGDPSDGEGVTNLQIRDWIGQNLITVEAIPPTLSPAAEQITGVETWFWPGGSTATQSRQASAGSLSVVVEARFEAMAFDLGEPDSEQLVCTEFAEWTDGADESPCTHTYLLESPADGFELVATTTWRFWWQDVGFTAFDDYATASPSTGGPVPVRDLEAVISARD